MTTHPWTNRRRSARDGLTRVAGGMSAAILALVGAKCAHAQGGQVVSWGVGGSEPPASLLKYSHIACGSGFMYALKVDGTFAGWGRNDFSQTSTPANLTVVTQLACGEWHTYALKGDGTLVGWGRNDHGQTETPSDLAGVTQVSCGDFHTYALKSDGTLVGWGRNDHGQTETPSDLAGVTQVACGASYTYALKGNGALVGWGDASCGQTATPANLNNVIQVSCGRFHTYALKSDGTLVGWGASGECLTVYEDLTATPAISNVVQVACGTFHTYALRGDGTLVGWGESDIAPAPFDTPVEATNVTQVASRGNSTCALKSNGTLVRWGTGFGSNQTSPSNLTNVTQVAAGPGHAYALQDDGTLVGWGGVLYDETTTPAGLTNVAQVACGYFNTCALKVDGTLVGWGWIFTTPPGLAGVTQVACGLSHNYALKGDGTLVGWGLNTFGQTSTPASVQGVTQVSCGGYHTYALKGDGTLLGWGRSDFGQTSTPASVYGATQVSCGELYTYALKGDGTLLGWGSNDYGQTDTPLELTRVTQVACGPSTTYALRGDGTIVAWGYHGGTAPTTLTDVIQVAHGVALLSPEVSNCSNPGGTGTATVKWSGSSWQQVAAWEWSEGSSPQTPGSMTNVIVGRSTATPGVYLPASVGSLCDARCATLDVPAGSSLLVPVDLSLPTASQDHSIDVGGLARLQGRVWLLASGASVLPADLHVPVVRAATFDGIFSIIQSDTPAPAGKFLTLVPSASLGGGTMWSLALRDLGASFDATEGDSYTFSGSVVDARAIDVNGDGFDDLALAISNGPAQPGLLQVIVNDGQGNFSDSTDSYATLTPALPTTLSVGDLNGDGRDDVVVGTHSDNSAHIYLNVLGSGATLQGSVAFEPSTSIALGAAPLSSAVLPHPDPRVAVGTAASTVVISPPTSGVTPQIVAVPVTPRAMRTRVRRLLSGGPNAGSVDAPDSRTVGRLLVLEPNSVGAYFISQIIDVPGEPNRIDVANIDRDTEGLEDAMTANRNPQQIGAGTPLAVLTLFKGTATGFGAPIPIAPQGASEGRDVAMVDLNGDGVRDVVSVHQTLVGRTDAVAIQVNQLEPGGPLTIGAQNRISSTQPVFCPRGDVLGPGAEGVFIVNTGAGSSIASSGADGPRATPYRAIVPDRPACPADINRSGNVDGTDLAALLAAWGPDMPGLPADINRDGTVDGIDLALLLAAWGSCQHD